MYIATEKAKCLAVDVPGRGGGKSVISALLDVVALGVVALASLESLEACAW